jgi:DNA-binding response OmpR family regulator
VVYNLLSNAFKFVADGGEISVGISERETDRGAEVDIRVTDNGPGIDPAEVDRVFERFYQAPANKTGRVGFGIGLNLCYNIVRLHHGTISVANRTDGQTGAVFTISLPVGSDHLSADELLQGESAFTSADPVKLIAAGIEAVPAGEESDGKDKAPRRRYTHTVLVADDDKEIVDYLSRALGVRYRVIACADGAEALNKTIERLPDVVISDINMPKVDGFSLLTRLKSNNITSHIPVILLTSLSEHENKVTGLQKGADAYIDKPFDVEELMAHVQGLIDTRAKLRGKFAGEQDQRGKVEQVRMQGVSDRLMEKVMQVINEKFSDPELNVEFLAEQVGMSRTQLHRRMKEITGLSCGDFIRNFRMEQAARLLREGDVYVSQICYAVGFSNATHFSTAFRKNFGVSPSEYVQGAAAGPAADEETEKS